MVKVKSTKLINSFDKGPIRRSLFTNGAVSLFHQAKNFSGARVQLHFLAGSMFEKDEEHGLSHLIEHMMFKDIQDENIQYLEAQGATLNAYTYKENVCFELSCLARKLPRLLPVFFEQFLKLEFTKEELQKEKQVIMQELKDDLDDHETGAIELTFAKNFQKPLGHPIGGNISKVRNFTEKEIRSYYKRFFTPDRMVLTIVSGRPMGQLETMLAEKMVSNLPHKVRASFRFKPTDKVAKLKHFKLKKIKKVENSLLVISFDGPSIISKHFYEFILLDNLLFEGMSSYYFKKMRVEKPLIYGYGSSINSFAKNGSYLMIFNVSPKKLEQVKAIAIETLKELDEGEIENQLLEQAKEKFLENWELAMDDLDERVELIANNEIYQLADFSYEQIREKLSFVTTKSLTKLAKMLIKSDYSELIFQPEK